MGAKNRNNDGISTFLLEKGRAKELERRWSVYLSFEKGRTKERQPFFWRKVGSKNLNRARKDRLSKRDRGKAGRWNIYLSFEKGRAKERQPFFRRKVGSKNLNRARQGRWVRTPTSYFLVPICSNSTLHSPPSKLHSVKTSHAPFQPFASYRKGHFPVSLLPKRRKAMERRGQFRNMCFVALRVAL